MKNFFIFIGVIISVAVSIAFLLFSIPQAGIVFIIVCAIIAGVIAVFTSAHYFALICIGVCLLMYAMIVSIFSFLVLVRINR